LLRVPSGMLVLPLLDYGVGEGPAEHAVRLAVPAEQ
jgi:hypothetical protein